MYDEKLVIENTKLIYKAIKDMNIYWNTADEYQEYYDAGLEGLIRGAKTYNYSTKPGTYLYKCIRNSLARTIYLSETDKRKINKETMISLDQEISSEGKEATLGELIPSDYNLEEDAENNLKIEAIIKELNKMENKKDALIIKMHYGLEGRTPKTYEEIAKKFGVSSSMICSRARRALKKLKEKSCFIERNIFMEEKIIEKESGEIISLVEKEDNNKPMLDQVNSILLEQLQTLKKLDLNDKDNSKMEIARSNAITSTSKIILQSIGIQIMVERQKYKFLEYK